MLWGGVTPNGATACGQDSMTRAVMQSRAYNAASRHRILVAGPAPCVDAVVDAFKEQGMPGAIGRVLHLLGSYKQDGWEVTDCSIHRHGHFCLTLDDGRFWIHMVPMTNVEWQ